MKNKNKFFLKIGLSVSTMLSCLTMGVIAGFFTAPVTASAEDTLVTMVDGGTIRVDEPYGMRFSADYSKTLFNDGQLEEGYEAGILLAKTADLQGEQLVIGTEGSKNVTAMVWDTEKGGENYYRLNAVMIGIPETDFDTYVTARAYLRNGDNVTYTNSVSRNVAQIASRAMADGYTGEVLENYIDKVSPQITLPTEVVENTVTLLVGQTISYSVAPEYLTATVSVAENGIVSVDGTKITATAAGSTEVTIKLGTSEKTFQVNVVGGTNGNVSLDNTFVWIMPDGSTVTPNTQSVQNNVYFTDYNTRNALMLDMDSSGAHVLNNVNNFAVEAEMTAGTPRSGVDTRGGVIVYAGASWMVAYYYNTGYANQIYYYDGSTGWLMANDTYVIDTVSSDVSEKVTIRVEKIGDEIRFYANGEYMRSFKEDAWTNAQIGFESKYTDRTVTVKEYKVIDEFSLAYHMASDKNMSLKYENGAYTFAESTGGIWTGALSSFDNGSMHVALLQEGGRNYTFEMKVKLSQAANASGTIGVMGMWVSGTHKSWLEISEDGTVNVWLVEGSYDTTTKTLTDFELTVADEILVKVVKYGTSLQYYINGQLAYDCTSQYYDYDARFGVFGISPAADGSYAGQYGAQYKIVSLTMN